MDGWMDECKEPTNFTQWTKVVEKQLDKSELPLQVWNGFWLKWRSLGILGFCAQSR